MIFSTKNSTSLPAFLENHLFCSHVLADLLVFPVAAQLAVVLYIAQCFYHQVGDIDEGVYKKIKSLLKKLKFSKRRFKVGLQRKGLIAASK